MPWYRKLHWQIIIGLVLGTIYGIFAAANGWSKFTSDWIAPWGTIFMNLLKLIAVPLVIGSLVSGVASLSNLSRLSRIGGKTIGIYVMTTAVAVTMGLVIVNLVQPGKAVPEETRVSLQEAYAEETSQRDSAANVARERGPLQMIVDIVPDNFLAAASENRMMLQVVFVSLLFGIGLIQLPHDKAKPLLEVFDSLADVVIRLVDVIMLMAPVGVFALIAGTITSVAGDNPAQILSLLSALGFYMACVIGGLAIHVLLTYGVMLKFLTPLTFKEFYSGIAPAQLVAFSTSSSGATLPVTMERVEEKLGVSEEISSFVLPLGATINMDGTAMYQAIAAVFIAQAMGLDLSLAQQVTIVLTAVMASIGTPAVPGAGIIMLVIILEAINVPIQGIALILGVDRVLDMLRTVCNVTGDATVSTVVAQSEGQLARVELSEEGDRIRIKPTLE
ncbi:MAG: dicarboxylate/amino acid:cation symporter [Xanthomonadales bacterium]|nr:dicarboxylate/amino acid:cation symporter [Gammaproteobacteria bacterium]NNE05278.1 dicarboxylate/amino acid:cation symporter [Xanthomonadales bacterium]NNL94826.1 dicarboxylate/amino acid:cation symporter [Xanthomonadales bacterium]